MKRLLLRFAATAGLFLGAAPAAAPLAGAEPAGVQVAYFNGEVYSRARGEAFAARVALETVGGEDWTRVTLAVLAEKIRSRCGCAVDVDYEALDREGVPRSKTVSIPARGVRLADALGWGLSQEGLAYGVAGGELRLSTPAALSASLHCERVRIDLAAFKVLERPDPRAASYAISPDAFYQREIRLFDALVEAEASHPDGTIASPAESGREGAAALDVWGPQSLLEDVSRLAFDLHAAQREAASRKLPPRAALPPRPWVEPAAAPRPQPAPVARPIPDRLRHRVVCAPPTG